VSPRTNDLVAPSFRDIFVTEFDFVCRTLRRFGIREADVHDVSQELFVAVNRGLSSFDVARPLRPWLVGFAVRCAANYRRLGWHQASELSDETAASSPRMTDRLAARQLVLRGLDALDFDKRIALVLHDMEGVTAPEIAAELGVPLNTVYSRVRLARAAFKEALRVLETEGEPR
jgi:RNA polymerase sigma-70 factor, ECF subfamily